LKVRNVLKGPIENDLVESDQKRGNVAADALSNLEP
jgi:hypothetical protein